MRGSEVHDSGSRLMFPQAQDFKTRGGGLTGVEPISFLSPSAELPPDPASASPDYRPQGSFHVESHPSWGKQESPAEGAHSEGIAWGQVNRAIHDGSIWGAAQPLSCWVTNDIPFAMDSLLPSVVGLCVLPTSPHWVLVPAPSTLAPQAGDRADPFVQLCSPKHPFSMAGASHPCSLASILLQTGPWHGALSVSNWKKPSTLQDRPSTVLGGAEWRNKGEVRVEELSGQAPRRLECLCKSQ